MFERIPDIPKYHVTVESEGNDKADVGDYAAGDTVSLTAGTPPNGKQFKEWTSSVDSLIFIPSANNATVTFIMPASVVTVTAVFDKIAETAKKITFIAGSGATVSPAEGYTNADGKLETLPVPTKNGYSFGGWFNTSAATGGTQIDTSTVFDGEAVIFARWTVTTYSITYNFNGGTAPTSANPSTYTVETPNFILNNPTRSGYDFAGWSRAYDTASLATSVTVYKGSTGDRHYTAFWLDAAPATYTLTVNSNPMNGGNTLQNSNQFRAGETVNISATANPGYSFKNWTTSSGGVTFADANSAATAFTMPANAVTVTAVFETIPTYLVTVSSAGTGATGSGNYVAGATVTISAGTPPSGQVFKNWTTSSGIIFTNAVDRTTTFEMPANTVTVTAVFEAIPTYLVTITGGGTGVSGGGSYKANDIVKIKAGTPPTGYTFKNWTSADTVVFGNASSDSTSFVMPARSVTVTANFTQTGKVPGDSIAYQGKKYPTVKIGGKTWMAENLNFDTANSTGSWCYENSADSCAKYGRLYNWNRAKTVCPTGWHLPDTSDWKALVAAAGGWGIAGSKLKSTSGWYDNYGTDEFGFSALPGGLRHSNGNFYDVGPHGYWWTVTEHDNGYAYNRYMNGGYDGVVEDIHEKAYALSVRCVKND